MELRRWIKGAELAGWRLSGVSPSMLSLRCACHGCDGALSLPLANPGPVPAPCSQDHASGYGARAFGSYEVLVAELRRRRLQLGLDQESLGEAIGFARGYMGKLEAFQRIAAPPTLLLWAQSLGLTITTAPAPLPPATLRAIEGKTAAPYQPNQARFKHV